jgi:hypothetical protein
MGIRQSFYEWRDNRAIKANDAELPERERQLGAALADVAGALAAAKKEIDTLGDILDEKVAIDTGVYEIVFESDKSVELIDENMVVRIVHDRDQQSLKMCTRASVRVRSEVDGADDALYRYKEGLEKYTTAGVYDIDNEEFTPSMRLTADLSSLLSQDPEFRDAVLARIDTAIDAAPLVVENIKKVVVEKKLERQAELDAEQKIAQDKYREIKSALRDSASPASLDAAKQRNIAPDNISLGD